jgi:uncharacterized protein (DUF736 family)
MSYDNTNRGALFKNDDKEQDNHPDYKGQINVGGQEFWISAWLKTSKNGTKFMSLSVKPKMAREHQGAPRNPPQPKENWDEPF